MKFPTAPVPSTTIVVPLPVSVTFPGTYGSPTGLAFSVIVDEPEPKTILGALVMLANELVEAEEETVDVEEVRRVDVRVVDGRVAVTVVRMFVRVVRERGTEVVKGVVVC